VKLEAKYGTKAMYHPGGGPYFDILEFLRNFDPRYVSVHYDTGHWLQVSQANMAAHLRLGAAYIGGFVWKDELVEKVDPATADATGRAAGAADNAPDPAQAATAGRGGAWRSRRCCRRRGRGWTRRRTRRRIGQRIPHAPGAGRHGHVDFALAARTLKEINFDGPTECQPEWTGLGGRGIRPGHAHAPA
jgi:sugar phosphate isomerase/epimerase